MASQSARNARGWEESWPQRPSGKLRLSREERDYIAGHALDSIKETASVLAVSAEPGLEPAHNASANARKITALSNLLGDVGWERPGQPEHLSARGVNRWILGELFPVAQLRPWLEEWQLQDNNVLVLVEQSLEIAELAEERDEAEVLAQRLIASAQTKLGIGAILLARIEKWMASDGN